MIELNGIQLDKTSAVPLYEQLRKALLELSPAGSCRQGQNCRQRRSCAPSSAFRACCTAGLQYADRRRLCGAYAGARYFCAQPRYPRPLPEQAAELCRRDGGFESGTPYRGAACRVGKLYPGTVFTAQAGTRGSLLSSCAYALCQRKAFVLVENYVPESVFPGIDATTLPSARCTMSLKPSITRRSLNRAVS